jgi:hypothetical protein
MPGGKNSSNQSASEGKLIKSCHRPVTVIYLNAETLGRFEVRSGIALENARNLAELRTITSGGLAVIHRDWSPLIPQIGGDI